MSENEKKTAERQERGEDRPAVEPDTVSDPAKGADTGDSWTDEGGAMPQGPATDEDAADHD